MSAYIVDKTHIDLLVVTAIEGVRQPVEPTYPDWATLGPGGPDAAWPTVRWYTVDPRRAVADAGDNYFARLAQASREARWERADQIGQMLLDANVASVAYRYGGENATALPGPVSRYWLTPYRFEDPRYRLTAAEALQALAGYEYQACEPPTWEDSEASRFVDALRRAAIRHVPGVERAPWEWTAEQLKRQKGAA